MKIFITWLLLLMSRPVWSNSQNTLVHLFEWNWKDIVVECEDYLGPKGIYGVQVSPPNEHAVLPGRPWYERYQPVSFDVISRSGSEVEFREMIDRCQQAGVSVYVDAVMNHTAKNPRVGEVLKGIGGTEYGRFKFKEFSDESFFSRCRGGVNDEIKDWNSRFEIFHCNLLQLADLKTSLFKVQNVLSAYLGKLAGFGVKGLRVDAAKHVEAGDLRAIYRSHFDSDHIYQEVIDMGAFEVVKSSEYLSLGKVLNFRYGSDLGRTFRQGKLSWLENFGEAWGYTPSDRSVVFLDNHDTQRSHTPDQGTLTYKEGPLYVMASAFMLAWPYGQPVLMSSYDFKDFAQGPPTRAPRFKACEEASWICEHRQLRLEKLFAMRRSFRNPFVSGWWSNGQNAIAFSRDSKHLFVFNREKIPLIHIPLKLGLLPGRYSSPEGQEIEVSAKGGFDLKINANDFAFFSRQ